MKSNISPKWLNVKSAAQEELSLLAEVCPGNVPQAAFCTSSAFSWPQLSGKWIIGSNKDSKKK